MKPYTVVIHGEVDDYNVIHVTALNREEAEIAASRMPAQSGPEGASYEDNGYSICAVFAGYLTEAS